MKASVEHCAKSGLTHLMEVMIMGQNIQSFKDKYVGNTLCPEWVYSLHFPVEKPSGDSFNLEVYDYDAGE